MIVERMEQREMQDRRQRRALWSKRTVRPADGVFVGLAASRRRRARPSCGRAAARTARARARRSPSTADRLDIGVAGEQQMRGDAFEKRRAVLARVRPREQIEQRMRGRARRRPRTAGTAQRADVLGDQLHRAIDDGVLR